MGWIKIVGPQQAKFFAAQPGVVRKSEHEPITQRYGLRRCENGVPLVIRRNPGQFREPRDQPAVPLAAKSLARCVSAPTDGIRFALAFLYEMVVEETHGHQTLLERRVCQTDARIEDDYACSTSVRASDQIAHVAGDLSASGR